MTRLDFEFDPVAWDNARRIAKQMCDESERERRKREFWDGFALWLACLVFGPCYVLMIFAFAAAGAFK